MLTDKTTKKPAKNLIMSSNIFDQRESEVRSYCRSFPAIFWKSKNSSIFSEDGAEYIDMFSGAGALNYGHNNTAIKDAVIKYLQADGICHSLDMWTAAKERFMKNFVNLILEPRGMPHKIQFTGPTGANAVEAALKLAKKVKGRSNIVGFTNAYHGLSAGALSLTCNRSFRHESYINRLDVATFPFDGYLGSEVNTLNYLRRCLEDTSSGLDLPAGILVETVQAEGGINVARIEWLQELQSICRQFEILLIVDDIQVGNGRTGTYFSFEEAGIKPDMVILSKSLSGLGVPMSVVLISPEFDQWEPAEHTGTFRGNDLAFVAAAEALEIYWSNSTFQDEVQKKGKMLKEWLSELILEAGVGGSVRGRGLIWGIEFQNPEIASAISKEAFTRNLIIETAGSENQVLKLLPSLLMEEDIMKKAVKIIEQSLAKVQKDLC